MERDRIVKRVSEGESAGSRSVDRQRKRWIDTVNEFLKKRNSWGVARGMNPRP